MRPLTKEEFLSLPFSLWGCDISHDEFYCHEDINFDEQCTTLRFESWAVGTVILESQCGIQLEFDWTAHGGDRTYQEAYEFEISVNTDADIELRDAVLVDEDGHELDSWEVDYALSEIMNNTAWKSSVEELLPKIEIEEIDIDEDSNMKTYTVERDDDRCIKFKGELIAEVSSAEVAARWTDLSLYRTQGGKYICEKINCTRWQSEHDAYSGAVCETTDDVINFFGMTRTAKRLYKEADIDASLEVE